MNEKGRGPEGRGERERRLVVNVIVVDSKTTVGKDLFSFSRLK